MYGLDHKFIKMILQTNASAAEGVLPRGVARAKSANIPPRGAGNHADSSMWIRVNVNDAKQVPKDVYPASQGQDLIVLELLGNKRGGFYIDIGARYWHKGSNTFALDYYHGWSGICVEPDSHFFRGLSINRTCNVICNNPIDTHAGSQLPFSYAIGQTVSKKGHDHGEKITVNMKTVMDKLGKRIHMPTVIDYLSLDVEGAEFATLKGIDLDRYVFLVMSIERPSLHIHLLLIKSGYSWLTQLGDLGSNLGNRQTFATANSSSLRFFGECVYIHKSLPKYTGFMDKYRPTAVAAWRYVIDVKASYLERPPWKVLDQGRV
jgi:FkbM family methyltransferase